VEVLKMKVNFTVLQMAECAGVDREAAYGFITFLQARGMARFIGSVKKAEKTKGRSAGIYEMDLDVADEKFQALLRALQKYEAAETPVTPAVSAPEE
jgi:predicted ArsR family transcriptional regulator